LQVDKANGVVHGVKILGLESQNRRRYTLECIQAARPLYEGVKVNLDHPTEPYDVRSIRDRFGKLINVKATDAGLFGDLLFNPTHQFAESFCWWAEHQPDCLGLSHNAVGDGEDDEKSGLFVIHTVSEVRSVDLVADPATTASLYEHCENCEKESMDEVNDIEDLADGDGPAPEESFEDHLCNAVTAIIKDTSLDMAEKKKKLLACLKLMDDEPAEAEESDDKPQDGMEEGEDERDDEECTRECVESLRHSKDKNVRSLVKAYHRLVRENAARKLCEASRIPATLVFIESLIRAGSEESMKELIEDRKAIVNKPRSSGRVNEEISTEDFVRRLKA
jgi:hypothetical protein